VFGETAEEERDRLDEENDRLLTLIGQLRQRMAELEATNADLEAEYELVRDNLMDALAQIRALQDDATLGKLVRRMHVGWALHCDYTTPEALTCWILCDEERDIPLSSECDTPETALKEVLGKKAK
jgi:hypothetical protein